MLFRPEALADKRRRVHGAIILSVPLRGTIVTYSLVAITLAATVFLFSFDFHRKETARGFITSTGGVISLRAKNGGRLSRLFVRVGDVVQEGEPIFEATTDIESTHGPTRRRQLETTENRLHELDDQAAMVSRSFAEKRLFLTGQKSSLSSHIEQLQGQLALKRQILDIGKRNLERVSRLRVKQHASDREVSRQLEIVLTHQTELAALENDISAKESDIQSLAFELKGLPNDEARELSELSIRRNALQQSRLEQLAQGSYLVRSPTAGRISAVQAHMGQELLASVPVVSVLPEEAKMMAVLLAPSRAIGFLENGDRVNLLVDAFPYQKFGVQTGRIRDVSRSSHKPGELSAPFTTDESAYKVIVDLDRDYVMAYGQRHPLRVDMTLSGDLIVDRRSLIAWILEPLAAVRF